MSNVPYSLDRFARDSQGEALAWPIGIDVVKALNRALHVELRNLALGIGDDDRRTTFIVGAPPILVTLLMLGTAHLTVAAARRANLVVDTSDGSIAAALIAGCKPDGTIFFDRVRQRTKRAARPNRSNLVRRLAHRVVTNRGPGLIGRPVTVLNHNGLLQAVARGNRGHGFRYETPERLLAGIRLTTPQGSEEDIETGEAVAGLFQKVLTQAAAPAPGFLTEEVAGAVSGWLATVDIHRRIVTANWTRPPKELWTGTGGNHISRLAAACVREVGGRVVVHEHGGGGHIHRDLGPLHLHEFSLCDRFVADTAAKASVYADSLDPDQLWTPKAPEIVGRPDGGHGFDWLGGARKVEVKRVMYVTTAFVGEVQYPLQPLLPDVIHADWQGRLLDGLAGQGFEMLCKQHPEGLLRGEPLKVSSRAEYVGGQFPECIDRADAFVFDYPATTALWEAICTEKPVLFIDLGLADWNPAVREKFAQRCAVVSARFDARNRPVVDFAEAAAALRAAPMDDGFASAYLTGRMR